MARHYEDDTVDFTGEATRRLRPPSRLQGRAKDIFIEVVTGCDPRHFRPADLPLLERYAEACALAEKAAEMLAAEGAVVDDKVNPWFSVHASATKTVNGLALRLRLGPQSRAPRQPKTIPQPTSYYERLELEADDDDGGTKPS
jgi:phage terminase small subunit